MRTPSAVLLAACLWLGCYLEAPVLWTPLALVLLCVAVPVSVRGHGRWALALVLVAMVVLGAGLAGGRRTLAARSSVAHAAAASATVPVSGRVVAEPRVTSFGSWTILRVSAIAGRRTAGRVLLRHDIDVAVGQTMTGSMRISALPSGVFGRHLADAGVTATADPVGTPRLGPAPAVIASTTAIRRRTSRLFDATLPSTPAALLGGMVFGMRDEVPTAELTDAGLSHLVVVSGRHAAILLAGVVMVLGACGVGVRGRSRAALAAIWWFVVLTRWQPSVMRAAVMVTIVLVGVLRGRPRDPPHTLAMTVVVLLAIDPLLARQVGFALSVLATGGVLVALLRTAGARPLSILLAATVGAQVATAPVVLVLSGTLPLAALPANLVAGPAAAVAQVLGLAAAGLVTVGAPGAIVVTRLAGPPLWVVWWAATAFADLPALPPRQAISVLVVAIVLGLAVTRRRVSRSVAIGVVASAVLGAIVIARVPPAAPDALTLTAVDVGQGDGLLVEAPDGHHGARMVIDGGPDAALLARELHARRIRTLDAVVLTHGDHDHAGGLASVLRRVDVAAVLVPSGAGAAPHTLSDSATEALGVARGRHIPVIGVHEGMRFALGSTVVEVLAPPPNLAPDAQRNTGSVVLRVSGPHGSMLLTGDTDATMQRALLERPRRLRADVLKVPHHGGATNAPGFLDAVHASIAVISVSADNSYGHPHPTTLADLAPLPTWSTDRHGSVRVTLRAQGIEVTTDRGG